VDGRQAVEKWVAYRDDKCSNRLLSVMVANYLVRAVGWEGVQRSIWSADGSGAGRLKSQFWWKDQGSLHNRSVNSVVSSSGRNPLRKMLGISNHRRTEGWEGKGRRDGGRMGVDGQGSRVLCLIFALPGFLSPTAF